MYSPVENPYDGLQNVGYEIAKKIEKIKQQYREYQQLKRMPHVFALSTPDSRQRGDLVIREAQRIENGYVLLDNFERGDTEDIDELEATLSQLVSLKERKLKYPLVELEHTAITATPYKFLPRYQHPSPRLTLRFKRHLPDKERQILVDSNIDDIDGWTPKGNDYYHAVEATKWYTFQIPFLNSLGYTLDIIPESQLDMYQPRLSPPR